MRHTQKRPPAVGVAKSDGTKGCVVHFPNETFDQIRERAIREKTSFGEQVRTLVEWGLESEIEFGE